MPFIDAQIVHWATSGRKRELLVQDKDEIASELRSWAARRTKNYEDVVACRLNHQAKTREILSKIFKSKKHLPAEKLKSIIEYLQTQMEQTTELSNERESEDVKARYFLESIKACGVT